MNLPLQKGAVVRSSFLLSGPTRGDAVARVFPAAPHNNSNVCGTGNQTCRCGSNATEYSCVPQDDQCGSCGDNHP
jgi:hypothetical protein